MEPSNNDNAVSGGETATNYTASGCPRRNVDTYKDRPSIIWRLPIDGESYNLVFSSTIAIVYEWENAVPVVANQGRVTEYHPDQKFPQSFLAECYLMQNSWLKDPTCMAAMTTNLILDSWETDKYYFNDAPDPCVLEARVKKSRHNEDNPSFDTATRGPFQAQFWQAMKTEFNTLTKEFDCWEYVPNPVKNILPSTWAFKIKQYPDGRVKKFKARFFTRRDRQQEGINYFKIWAPVVQWSTVGITMTLAVKMNLISVQCDITAAFIHGRVPITITIYVHQPQGFHQGDGNEVLRLKRTPYDLKQSP
jgi:hypothetical protein